MRARVIILFLISILSFHHSLAQENGDLTQSRILFVLDRSSSMIQPWAGGKEKYKIADLLIEKLMDSIASVNDQVEYSLRVFGHQHTVPENDCYDTKNEVPFSQANRARMQFRLEDIKPLGVTAIAYTLQQAAEEDIVDEAHNAYSIILITDGGESCGGDVCSVMEKLLKKKIYFKPYILSLEADPQLRKEYACVGNYLEVTKKGDIAMAVGTIVEAFRPMLKITRSEYKNIQKIAANAPSVMKVKYPPVEIDTVKVPIKIETPKVEKPKKPAADTVATKPVKTSHITQGEVVDRPPHVKMTRAPQAHLQKMFVAFKAKRKEEQTIAVNMPTLNIEKYEPPVRPAHVPMTTIRLAKLRRTPVERPSFRNAATIAQSTPEVHFKETPPPPPPPQVRETPSLTKAKVKRMKLYGHIFMVEEQSFPLLKFKVPEIKFHEDRNTQSLTKASAVSKTQPKRVPKTGEYSVMHDDAQQTTLEVYLTNGKGKFFSGTPRVFLIDPKTGKEFRKFFRTIDRNGNPDPQTNIPAGKYYLTIEGRDDLEADVDMLPNKKTMVYVIVKNFSLFFTYAGAAQRPVKEFTAIVTQRNEINGKVITQKCSETKEYEPGNYHVVINTLPEDVRNIDLDDVAAGGIVIPQPGFAKFTTETQARTVTLFKEDGDRFAPFYTLDLNSPSAQHLQIQPGRYQAHYQPGAAKFSSTEKVVLFTVKSNQETEVVLNK